MSEGIKRFLSIHSRLTIESEINKAQQVINESGSHCPDSTFENGVIQMGKWMLGLATAPMSGSDDSPIGGQVVYDREAKEQRYVIASLVPHYHRDLDRATHDVASHDIEPSDLQSTALDLPTPVEFEPTEYPQKPD